MIKMSFLLNVSNGRSKSEQFSIKDIEMLVDSEKQNWFKQAHVGKSFQIVNIHRSTAKLAEKDQKTRAFLQAEGWCHIMTSTREDPQRHDIFISLPGALCVIVNSQKDKSKALKKHILKDIIPRGFYARTEEIQGKHQQAITGRDNQIKALEFRNEEHQQKF